MLSRRSWPVAAGHLALMFPMHAHETERLEALRRYFILDTPPELEFDDITRLVADICEAPIALVSFVDEDRQWFKSAFGLDVRETARAASICAHAIDQRGLFIVRDTLTDARFASMPLVRGEPYIRFYAGAPLTTADGHALGTLCVIDHKPRGLSEEQKRILRVLARQVMTQLELRLAVAIRDRAMAERARTERELRASHQRIAAIFEAIPDPFYGLDQDWRFTFVNRRLEEITGKHRDELIGRNAWEVFPQAASGTCHDVYQRVARERRAIRIADDLAPAGNPADFAIRSHDAEFAREDGLVCQGR